MTTDEQRLQTITDQLILVRDNLFRGMSKSIQKLQARSINETLGLQSFIESPQHLWVSLTEDQKDSLLLPFGSYWVIDTIEAMLKENNGV